MEYPAIMTYTLGKFTGCGILSCSTDLFECLGFNRYIKKEGIVAKQLHEAWTYKP